MENTTTIHENAAGQVLQHSDPTHITEFTVRLNGADDGDVHYYDIEAEAVDFLIDMVDEGVDACPGSGCQPGDGITDSCTDMDGCGEARRQAAV